MSSAALASPLGRMLGRSEISEDEFRALRAAAWHRTGAVLILPDDPDLSDFQKAFAKSIGVQRHGPRD